MQGLFRGKKVVFDDTADRLPYEHGTEDKQMLSRDELRERLSLSFELTAL